MDEVKDLSRFWVDKDTGIVIRKWTDEEYESINPHTHIFEKYWSFRCPNCSFIPIPVLDKREAERRRVAHLNNFWCSEDRKRHKGFVEYRDHKLICLEGKYEFIKDLNMWVYKQEYYVN